MIEFVLGRPRQQAGDFLVDLVAREIVGVDANLFGAARCRTIPAS